MWKLNSKPWFLRGCLVLGGWDYYVAKGDLEFQASSLSVVLLYRGHLYIWGIDNFTQHCIYAAPIPLDIEIDVSALLPSFG